MTTIEQRLRSDLPQLADALLAHSQNLGAPPTGTSFETSLGTGHRHKSPSPRRLVAAAVFAVAGLGIIGAAYGAGWLSQHQGGIQVDAARTATPSDVGQWKPIADAPIKAVVHAVSGWTGSRAAFWAGSDLGHGTAFTEGALYDPGSNRWEPMTTPGWGHPGLTSTTFDGELFAVAKGSGTRIEPTKGQWHAMAAVQGMELAAVVGTDDGIWGLGPLRFSVIDRAELAIAQYHPDDDRWTYGPVWQGTDDQAAISGGIGRLESTVVWTGSEIAVCDTGGKCVGFDPVEEAWRSIPDTIEPSKPSLTVATDLGLTMVTQPSGEGSPIVVEVLGEHGWDMRATQIPVESFETATVAGAGNWIVIFAKDQPPILVDLISGAWLVDTDNPVAGVQAPNTVWTGRQLIVWGGIPNIMGPATGAIWEPPPS